MQSQPTQPSGGRPLMERIAAHRDMMTPKGRALADFIMQQPRQAVFLRTRGLAAQVGVSESTVVRFVSQLGYEGYGEFIQALRDHVDSELTLLERIDLSDSTEPEAERLRRVIYQEIADMKRLYETLDIEGIGRAVQSIQKAPSVVVVGSRLSYTYAYYLGWSLTKVRTGVQILAGSDSAAIDWLTTANPDALVIMVATSRYPNELIRLAKLVVRQRRPLLLITDSQLCPLVQFASQTLVAPCRHIPVVGSPSAMGCLINCLTHELISRGDRSVKEHQQMLEQAYTENDIWFNLERRTSGI